MSGNKAFAQRIATRRQEMGFSKSSFARALGVTTTCVWNWEEGNTFPRPDALRACAAALDTTTAFLERGVEPPARQAEPPPAPSPVAAAPVTAARSLEEIIREARRDIATAAGLSFEQVKVVLEFGA